MNFFSYLVANVTYSEQVADQTVAVADLDGDGTKEIIWNGSGYPLSILFVI